MDFKYAANAPLAQTRPVTIEPPGTLQGSINASNLQIVIEDAHWTNPLGFQISFSAQPGLSYEIQSSTNAHDWLSVGTAAASGQKASFVDTNALSAPFRLYRVIRSPF